MRARVLLRDARTRAVILLRHDRADNFLRNRELLEMGKCGLLFLFLRIRSITKESFGGSRTGSFVVVRTSSLFHANRSLVETPEILVWDAHTLPSATTLSSMDYSFS